MKYQIATYLNKGFEIDDEMTVTAVSAFDAVRIFASNRGFKLTRDSFDYAREGQYRLTEDNDTIISVIEI